MSWGTIDEHAQGSSFNAPGNGAQERSLKVSNNGPYVIYFCSEQLAQTAGMGTEAIRAKIKAGIKPLKDTIFEQNSVLDAFKKAGITEFFKVPFVKENINLAKKYQVMQDNTLVICSPKGEAIITLSGDQCNYSNIMKILKLWNETYAAWQKKM